jgi:hypothetical protein
MVKDINLFLGRFQPFTKGHERVLQALYKENGYPTVVACIANVKYDTKHPFDDSLISKEFNICLKGKDYFEDYIYVRSAAINKVGEELVKNGYRAHLWGCGSDRASTFEKMASNTNYTIDFPDDFKVFVVDRDDASNGIDGISATKVREAIKNDDIDSFKKMMPDNAEKLFGNFKKQLIHRIHNVKESLMSLTEYLRESLK